MDTSFSHLDSQGNLSMVDVGHKPPTERVAVAEAKLKKAGAHYVVRSVADLPAVLAQIAAEMRAGKNPF